MIHQHVLEPLSNGLPVQLAAHGGAAVFRHGHGCLEVVGLALGDHLCRTAQQLDGSSGVVLRPGQVENHRLRLPAVSGSPSDSDPSTVVCVADGETFKSCSRSDGGAKSLLPRSASDSLRHESLLTSVDKTLT